MFSRIKLTEPVRGEKTLIAFNNLLHKHEVLAHTIPLASDIFVFFYPIYLVGMYLYGINKKETYYRDAALFVFFAGWGAMFVNMLIKIVFTKTRPDVVMDLLFENREGLVLETLPRNTFPSDHAAMSFAIATATLVRGIKNKNRAMIYRSIPLYLMAAIMGFGRIMIGIHWPTDILMGIIVGLLVPTILLKDKIYKRLYNYLIAPLLKLQEWIRRKLFRK